MAPRLRRGQDNAAERLAIYRLIGPTVSEQMTPYRSVLAFPQSVCCSCFFRNWCRGGSLHSNDPATTMTPPWRGIPRSAIVTNTNWQAYSGETTQGHLFPDGGLDRPEFRVRRGGDVGGSGPGSGFARRNSSELTETSGRPGPGTLPHREG